MVHPERDNYRRSPHQALDELGRDIRRGRDPRVVDDFGAASYHSVAAPAPTLDRGGPHAGGLADPYRGRAPGQSAEDTSATARAKLREAMRAERPAESHHGLPAIVALIVLLAIAGAGGLIDMASGTTVRGWFNISFILASVVAILIVRRRSMFPIVVAPPIVYAVASGSIIYLRSGGLSNRSVLLDGAANWLIYGFPSLAAATAGVLIIAGIRTIARK